MLCSTASEYYLRNHKRMQHYVDRASCRIRKYLVHVAIATLTTFAVAFDSERVKRDSVVQPDLFCKTANYCEISCSSVVASNRYGKAIGTRLGCIS